MTKLNQTDTERLIGYVARFKREVVAVTPYPMGLSDLMDYLEESDWNIYGEEREDIEKIARREWMRG